MATGRGYTFTAVLGGTSLADLVVMLPPARIPLAIFLTSFSPGGTERQTIELLRRLDRERFSVHLACFHRSGEWRERAEELAESVAEFPIYGFASRATVRQAAAFADWCRRLRIGVLHAADLYANIFALPAAAWAGVPVRVGSRRDINPGKSAAQIATQRAAYAFAHRIVANSQAAARRLRQEGVGARRISVIHNGIDLETFRPADCRPDSAGVAGEAAPIRRVVTVARFRPEKRLDTFIEAAAAAVRQVPDLEFTLVGSGPLGDALEAQAAGAGLGGRVRFLGLREDVAQVLRDHDMFVLPSESEAFPNAVLEAMATGLPIVATRVGGIPELIAHRRSGILIAPGRPEELAAAMVDLARHPSFGRALGRRARADADAGYSFERMVAQFSELYLSETVRRRRPQAARTASSQPVAS